MASTTDGASIAARTRMRPLQRGQASTSRAKTRRMSSAQERTPSDDIRTGWHRAPIGSIARRDAPRWPDLPASSPRPVQDEVRGDASCHPEPGTERTVLLRKEAKGPTPAGRKEFPDETDSATSCRAGTIPTCDEPALGRSGSRRRCRRSPTRHRAPVAGSQSGAAAVAREFSERRPPGPPPGCRPTALTRTNSASI